MRAPFATTALATALLAACFRPRPPTLTPRAVEVINVTPAGLAVRVSLTANNPNGFQIDARQVAADVSFAGRGMVHAVTPAALSLPAHADSPVTADLMVPWGDLPSLVNSTVTLPSVPYHVNGQVTVGVRSMTFDVPFQLDGAVSRQQLMGAAMQGVMQNPLVQQGLQQLGQQLGGMQIQLAPPR